MQLSGIAMASKVFTCVDPRQEVPKTKPSDEGSDTPSTTSSSTPEPSAPMESTNSSILDQTVKGLKEVASVSYASVKEWATSPRFSKEIDGSSPPESPHHKAARKALSDLMSPFMACHLGMNEMYENRPSKSRSFHNVHQFSDLKESLYNLHQTDSETIFSMDTAVEDEMLQMRRLASWGTNATNDTLDTETYYGEQGTVTDDDGRVIPTVLLETANKRREKRMRTRVVRFDYPPISSLRECPRHNPDDLPDLFFTEEELDEIEADRSSAVYADDIEIVAVASAKSLDSYSLSNTPERSRSSDSFDRRGGGSGNFFPPSKLSRKPRSSSPHPRRPAKGSWSEPPSDSIAKSSSREDPRLIRGVQIYLRERSTGKRTHKK